MEFPGRVYFDFTSPDVWRFFLLLVNAQDEGVRIGLDWIAFRPADERAAGTDTARLHAASELVRQDVPSRHGLFVASLLTAVHRDAAAPAASDLVALGCRVAEIPEDVTSASALAGPGAVLVDNAEAQADALGVDAVPTLYRHGPVLSLRLTGAVASGGATERLETIDRVLGDDALWELRKP